jgi:hypothetical protein
MKNSKQALFNLMTLVAIVLSVITLGRSAEKSDEQAQMPFVEVQKDSQMVKVPLDTAVLRIAAKLERFQKKQYTATGEIIKGLNGMVTDVQGLMYFYQENGGPSAKEGMDYIKVRRDSLQATVKDTTNLDPISPPGASTQVPQPSGK